MTATPPFVVSADDLIVRSAPRNQRASPSPGCIAMAVEDASGGSGIDMGASLPTPLRLVHLRARNKNLVPVPVRQSSHRRASTRIGVLIALSIDNHVDIAAGRGRISRLPLRGMRSNAARRRADARFGRRAAARTQGHVSGGGQKPGRVL